MKKMLYMIVSLFCILLTSVLMADDTPLEQDIYPSCHAHAMIGFDSVINSRLGVPAERTLEVTNFNHTTSAVEKSYMLKLLRTMLGAYLWQDSPQDYYVQVFEQCISPIKDQAVG